MGRESGGRLLSWKTFLTREAGIGNFSLSPVVYPTMANHHELTNFIWQIADLLRGPYRPPQYERVMLPMTVLRRFDCVLAPTKAKVLAEHEKRKGGKFNADALDKLLNKAAGQRFHNHLPRTEELGLVHENLIRGFNERANETDGDHFTPVLLSKYSPPFIAEAVLAEHKLVRLGGI